MLFSNSSISPSSAIVALQRLLPRSTRHLIALRKFFSVRLAIIRASPRNASRASSKRLRMCLSAGIQKLAEAAGDIIFGLFLFGGREDLGGFTELYQFADIKEGCAIRHSARTDRKSTRLNSSHLVISYAVFCLKK